MTFLDFFAESVGEGDAYEFWSVKGDGTMLFYKFKEEDAEVLEDLFCLDGTACNADQPAFVPYDVLEEFSWEVEADGRLEPEPDTKYPLVCVRGICNRPCSSMPESVCSYFLFDLPACYDHVVGENALSSKYPNMYDALVDIFRWHAVCPYVDAAVYVPDYLPYNQQELDYAYAWALFKISHEKLEVVTNKQKAEKIYKEYNRKYPSTDLKILDIINDGNEVKFYF